jgi:hypothetical protein
MWLLNSPTTLRRWLKQWRHIVDWMTFICVDKYLNMLVFVDQMTFICVCIESLYQSCVYGRNIYHQLRSCL